MKNILKNALKVNLVVVRESVSEIGSEKKFEGLPWWSRG